MGGGIKFYGIKFVFINKDFKLEILFCNSFDESSEEIFLEITERKFKYKSEFKYVKIQEINN